MFKMTATRSSHGSPTIGDPSPSPTPSRLVCNIASQSRTTQIQALALLSSQRAQISPLYGPEYIDTARRENLEAGYAKMVTSAETTLKTLSVEGVLRAVARLTPDPDAQKEFLMLLFNMVQKERQTNPKAKPSQSALAVDALVTRQEFSTFIANLNQGRPPGDQVEFTSLYQVNKQSVFVAAPLDIFGNALFRIQPGTRDTFVFSPTFLHLVKNISVQHAQKFSWNQAPRLDDQFRFLKAPAAVAHYNWLVTPGHASTSEFSTYVRSVYGTSPALAQDTRETRAVILREQASQYGYFSGTSQKPVSIATQYSPQRPVHQHRTTQAFGFQDAGTEMSTTRQLFRGPGAPKKAPRHSHHEPRRHYRDTRYAHTTHTRGVRVIEHHHYHHAPRRYQHDGYRAAWQKPTARNLGNSWNNSFYSRIQNIWKNMWVR